MKKLMVLGGNVIQALAISTAKELGYYVISADLHPEYPGHRLSDEYCELDILDKDAVLEVARSKQIDGIIPYSSDVLAPVAAYVSEKLELPGNSYHSVSILQNKGLFRQFMQEVGIPHPDFRVCHTIEDAFLFFRQHGKSILKPVDSSGAKGVAVIKSEIDILKSWPVSLCKSNCGEVIIEQFIDRVGSQRDCDFFVIDGKIQFWGMTYQIRLDGCGLEYYGLILPPVSKPEELDRKAIEYTQKIVDGLNVKQGPFNIEYISNGNEIFILDIGPRNGGVCIPNLFEIATGCKLTEWTIKAATGDLDNISVPERNQKPSLLYFVNSDKTGVLESVLIDDELKDKMAFSISLVGIGEKVHRYSMLSDTIAICIFVFNSVTEMDHYIGEINQFVKVTVR